jgi:hypothetical protein
LLLFDGDPVTGRGHLRQDPGRSAICRMYTDVQASGSIQVVSALISPAGTRCCCASASAEMTAASARITTRVNPDR